jgi:hypothetical protein
MPPPAAAARWADGHRRDDNALHQRCRERVGRGGCGGWARGMSTGWEMGAIGSAGDVEDGGTASAPRMATLRAAARARCGEKSACGAASGGRQSVGQWLGWWDTK